MAVSRKVLRGKVRKNYLSKIWGFLEKSEETPLRTGSNEIAIPIVDEEGNEDFLVITLKVPTGSRDGEPYDGYSMAEDYNMKLAAKAEKAKTDAAAKAKKIARDKKMRAQKAEMKAKREEKTGE